MAKKLNITKLALLGLIGFGAFKLFNKKKEDEPILPEVINPLKPKTEAELIASIKAKNEEAALRFVSPVYTKEEMDFLAVLKQREIDRQTGGTKGSGTTNYTGGSGSVKFAGLGGYRRK